MNELVVDVIPKLLNFCLVVFVDGVDLLHHMFFQFEDWLRNMLFDGIWKAQYGILILSVFFMITQYAHDVELFRLLKYLKESLSFFIQFALMLVLEINALRDYAIIGLRDYGN